MPGLSQLRQFSEDIKELGDEVRIRRGRGEQPVFVPVPDVPDVDDSSEFMLGMPDPNAPAPAASRAPVDLSGLGDIPGVTDMTGGVSAPPLDIPPELADILGPTAGAGGDMPDLSDFLDEPVAPVTASATATARATATATGSAPQKENDVPLGQDELDKLFAGAGGATATASATGSTPQKENDVPLGQDELDKLFAGAGGAFGATATATAAENAPQKENDVPLGQDELDKLFAGAGGATTTATATGSAPQKENDVPLGQDELDKLFAGMGASGATATASATGSAPQKENDVPLGQDELDKLFAGAGGATATATAAENAPQKENDVPLGQDELDKLFAGAGGTSGATATATGSAPQKENDVPLGQDELDKLFAGASGATATATAAESVPQKENDVPLGQDELDKLFAGAGGATAAATASATGNASQKENDVPLGQDELDKLFAGAGGATATASAAESVPQKENDVPLGQDELDKLFAGASGETATAAPGDMPDLSDFLTEADAGALPGADDAAELNGVLGDLSEVPVLPDDIAAGDMASSFGDFSLDDNLQEPDDLPNLDDLPDASALGADDGLPDFGGDFSLPDDLPALDDASDDFAFSGDAIDMGTESSDGDTGRDSVFADETAADETPAENAVPLGQDELDKLFAGSGADAQPNSSRPGDFDLPSMVEPIPDEPEPTAGDDLSNLFDTSDLDFPGDFSAPAPTDSVPDASMDVTPEVFDTSEMDGLDFSAEGSAGTALPFDEEFPITGEGGDDFELTDDFEIPGFSDTDTVPVDKKKGGFRLDIPDFSKAATDRPPNTLTEDEYETFKKNLSGYPLNLRIAVEDFIVKDEFKDDVIFEVIEKVLKKVSARQLAGHLEKLLDITIDVPRDYERRSVAEYEAYKQSFQYQLKNRILPAAVAGVVLAIFGFFLFQAGKRFIYQPMMARSLYKQGYTMLENNEYPQSEQLFEEAVRYKAVKKWFFQYAQGYRAHKQFERAAQMYRNILGLFKYDKQAGLEYAEMELYDRANYSRAEEIVRRDVLDHHINDADGLLLLGDTFLEWAEVDPEKYENARTEYSNLIQLYGATDLYMSRMMRYFIRTDNLPNVLGLKNRFYAKKKSLGAQDWTELSGYLLDKLYGNLSKTEESLRSSIEDVLDMLNTAVKLDPANPVARYNLSRYFLHNNNDASAQREMQLALDLFQQAPVRTKKNTYREINGNRILGELFAENREYIKAQEVYTRGINVYTEEHAKTGLEGDENTGKLYADLGDIDYFIAGDMAAALANYQTAVGMKNDTPTLNYRIGAIHYNEKDFDKALGSFIKTAEAKGGDPNLLLSLGNTLSLRGDNFAAQGYYSDLLTRLNGERTRRALLNPQGDADDNELVDMFLKANNNLGVTLYRLARQTGDSNKNAEALVRLSDSMRAWDALTRNPESMVRLEGSNLASQNSKYITHPYSDFEPAIYTDIPKTLSGEAGLE